MIGPFLGPNSVKTLNVGLTATMSDAMAKFLHKIIFLVLFEFLVVLGFGLVTKVAHLSPHLLICKNNVIKTAQR